MKKEVLATQLNRINYHNKMKISEAIRVLKLANKWRRGAEIEMPDPKVFGEAIDLAILKLKQNKKYISILKSKNHNLLVQLSDIKNGGY